jgi:hypothetical protein
MRTCWTRSETSLFGGVPHPDFAHEFAFFDHPAKDGFHAIAVGNEVEPFEFYRVDFGADVGVFLGM